MAGSYLVIVLTTALFLTGLLQFFLKEKHGRRYVIWKTILIIFMVLAFVGSLVQNLQNDRDNRTLRDKSTKSLGLIEENKNITGQLVELNKTIAKKNEEIVLLNKKISAQAENIAEMQRFSTGGDGYCFLIPMLDKNKQQFYVQRVGKYPLYNVQLVITDVIKAGKIQDEITKPLTELFERRAPKEDWEKLNRGRDFFADISAAQSQSTTTIEAPIVLPGRALIITLPYAISEKDNELKYLINIFSMNGNVQETVRYRRIQGKWRMSLRVMKMEGGHPMKTLQEAVDPEIPIE